MLYLLRLPRVHVSLVSTFPVPYKYLYQRSHIPFYPHLHFSTFPIYQSLFQFLHNGNLLSFSPLRHSLLRRRQCSRLWPVAGAKSRRWSGGICFKLRGGYRSFDCAFIDDYFEALKLWISLVCI
ncbi:hypothetical protein V8G54_026949 [Vigna mungo]|uniref:Uncharacterized protein n=1 Tax=Vigna mungo TaxID=3915 RepID=A0AAQ3N1I7_VIGMU